MWVTFTLFTGLQLNYLHIEIHGWQHSPNRKKINETKRQKKMTMIFASVIRISLRKFYRNLCNFIKRAVFSDDYQQDLNLCQCLDIHGIYITKEISSISKRPSSHFRFWNVILQTSNRIDFLIERLW